MSRKSKTEITKVEVGAVAVVAGAEPQPAATGPAADADLTWVLVSGAPLLESIEQCRVKGNSTLPVLDCVKIAVTDHRITLTTTNLEKYTTRVFGCGAGEMSALVDWKPFYDWLEAVVSVDTVVNLANDNGRLIAIATDDGGKTTNRARFTARPVDEFPMLARCTPHQLVYISAANLRSLLRSGDPDWPAMIADHAGRAYLVTFAHDSHVARYMEVGLAIGRAVCVSMKPLADAMKGAGNKDQIEIGLDETTIAVRGSVIAVLDDASKAKNMTAYFNKMIGDTLPKAEILIEEPGPVVKFLRKLKGETAVDITKNGLSITVKGADGKPIGSQKFKAQINHGKIGGGFDVQTAYLREMLSNVVGAALIRVFDNEIEIGALA